MTRFLAKLTLMLTLSLSLIGGTRTHDDLAIAQLISSRANVNEPTIAQNVQRLIEQLKTTTSPSQREALTYSLRGYGAAAHDAIPILKAIVLRDQSYRVRSGACTALASIATADHTSEQLQSSIAKTLVFALNDPRVEVRYSAAYGLGQFGAALRSQISPALERQIQQDDEPDGRYGAAIALAQLWESDLPSRLHDPVINQLLPVLAKEDSRDLYSETIAALDKLQIATPEVIDQLLQLSQSSQMTHRNRSQSVLIKLLQGLVTRKDHLSSELRNQVQTAIEQFQTLATSRPDLKISAQRQFQLAQLKAQLQPPPVVPSPPPTWITPPIVSLGIGLIVVIIGSGIYWIKPCWLLHWLPSDVVIPTTPLKIPFNLIKFQNRILDAWVATHVETVRDRFRKLPTVSDRQIHLPLPIVIKQQVVAEPTFKDWQALFQEQPVQLLIQGQSGTGKTSLSCQLGLWALEASEQKRLQPHLMIPVLLEQELDFSSSTGKTKLLEAVRLQLNWLVDADHPIADDLCEYLLRRGRILLIIDHLSEWSELSRKELRLGLPNAYPTALVVNSRFEEPLDRFPKTTIMPQQLQGDPLVQFLERYLQQISQSDLLNALDRYTACLKLTTMVGKRPLTAFLVKLYAQQLIAHKQGIQPNLPDNIPMLMFSYLEEINRKCCGDAYPIDLVFQDAKSLAWECLKQQYQPTAIDRKTALAALGGEDAEHRLEHLERRIRIVQAEAQCGDRLRFSLDPLAEYLAAWALVEKNGARPRQWRTFFESIDQFSPRLVCEFLLTVQDCCTAGIIKPFPNWVIAELNSRIQRSAA